MVLKAFDGKGIIRMEENNVEGLVYPVTDRLELGRHVCSALPVLVWRISSPDRLQTYFVLICCNVCEARALMPNFRCNERGFYIFSMI